jgi:hypothetical protein
MGATHSFYPLMVAPPPPYTTTRRCPFIWCYYLPRAYLQAAAVIDGVHTELVATRYSNLIMVVVTQFNKIGSLVRCSAGVAGCVFLSCIFCTVLAVPPLTFNASSHHC